MIYFVGKDSLEGNKDITPNSIRACLKYFEDHKEIAFDIETTGLDPYTDMLLSYQLGDAENQFVIDHKYIPIYTKQVKSLLESKTLVIQNAKFDLQFLYHNGVIPTKVWDTMLAEALLNKGKPFITKNLGDIAYRYLDVKLDKHLTKYIFTEGLSLRMIKYAAEDTKYLLSIK